jgi:hypothetical protein
MTAFNPPQPVLTPPAYHLGLFPMFYEDPKVDGKLFYPNYLGYSP